MDDAWVRIFYAKVVWFLNHRGLISGPLRFRFNYPRFFF